MERNKIEFVSMGVDTTNESQTIGSLLEEALHGFGITRENAKKVKEFLRAHPDSPHTQSAAGEWVYRPIDGFVDGNVWRWFVWPRSKSQQPRHWGEEMDRVY